MAQIESQTTNTNTGYASERHTGNTTCSQYYQLENAQFQYHWHYIEPCHAIIGHIQKVNTISIVQLKTLFLTYWFMQAFLKKTHISANLKQSLEFIKEMVRVIRYLCVLCFLGLRCKLAERISNDSISHLPSSFFVIIISMSEFGLCDTRGNLKQTNATQV